MMSLGPAAAGHLGIDVRRLGIAVMVSLGLAAGGAVGAAGAVAFVGLVAGHGARFVAGEHHHRTLVAGFFLGAIVVVIADAVGRVVGGRFEIPIGLVTAVMGGPFLVWLIVSGRTAE
jgi:iron complex transport system permease protein